MEADLEELERLRYPIFSALGYTTLILLLPLQLLFSYFFYKRANTHPIVGIYPKLVFVGNGIMSPLLLLWGLSLVLPVPTIPCFVHYWLTPPLTPLAFLMNVFRAWRLLFQYEMTQDLLLVERTKSGHTKKADASTTTPANIELSWYARNRHLSHPRFLWRVAVMLVFYFGVILSACLPISRIPEACSSQTRTFTLVIGMASLIVMIAEGLLVMLLVIKLRRFSSDSYGLKRELTFSGIVVLVCIIAAFTGRLTLTNALLLPHFYTCILIFGSILVFGSITVHPVLMSCKHAVDRQARMGSSRPSNNLAGLTDLLNNPKGFQAFLRFTMAEFSSEYPLFWRRVQDLRSGFVQFSDGAVTLEQAVLSNNLASPTVLHTPLGNPSFKRKALAHESMTEALTIYQTYIGDKSPYTVSLPPELRESFETRLRSLLQQLPPRPELMHIAISSGLMTDVALANGIGGGKSPHHSRNPSNDAQRSGRSQRSRNAASDLKSPVTEPVTEQSQQNDEKLGAEIRKVYDEAQQEVMMVMQSSAFLRFYSSPLYKTWLSQNVTGWSPATLILKRGGNASSGDDVASPNDFGRRIKPYSGNDAPAAMPAGDPTSNLGVRFDSDPRSEHSLGATSGKFESKMPVSMTFEMQLASRALPGNSAALNGGSLDFDIARSEPSRTANFGLDAVSARGERALEIRDPANLTSLNNARLESKAWQKTGLLSPNNANSKTPQSDKIGGSNDAGPLPGTIDG